MDEEGEGEYYNYLTRSTVGECINYSEVAQLFSEPFATAALYGVRPDPVPQRLGAAPAPSYRSHNETTSREMRPDLWQRHSVTLIRYPSSAFTGDQDDDVSTPDPAYP